MKKQILLSMLLAMFTVASWGQAALQTDMLQASSNVDAPEHVYVLKNGRLRRMTPTTGPTETFYNVGLFAFFPVDDNTIENTNAAYKIYCVTSKKWVSYTPAEPGYYSEQVNFATLVDKQEDAEPWYVIYTTSFRPKDKCYNIKPYNSNNSGQLVNGSPYRRIISDKFMNWFGSKDNYPNDVQDMTVGLSMEANAKVTGGGAWVLRYVSGEAEAASYCEDINEEFIAWDKDLVFGDVAGTYVKDESAYNQAYNNYTEAYAAKDMSKLFEAVKACHDAVSVRGLVEGRFYRFRSAADGWENCCMGLGVEDYDTGDPYYEIESLSAVESSEDGNPAVVWQYEKSGDNYYLRNVYSGLYPEEVKDDLTKVCVGKGKAFTYALETPATASKPAVWRIYIGDRRVSYDEYGAVVQGTGETSYFYIDRVNNPDDDFESTCVEWYKAHPKPDEEDVPDRISVSDIADYVVTPVGIPNTKTAIDEINAVIDNINLSKDDADLSKEKIWQMYQGLLYASTISGPYDQYKTYIARHGALSTKPVIYTTPSAEWATICVPARWGNVIGWKRYTCAALDRESLKLNEDTLISTNTEPNVPYIVKVDTACFEKKYQFLCFENDVNNVSNPKQDWLVGVLQSNVSNPTTDKTDKFYNVPVSDDAYDRYVLARNNNTKVTGFYRVSEKATNLYCGQYKCYLEIPKVENAARYSFLFFDEGNVETGIDNVLEEDLVLEGTSGNKDGDGTVYNMAGQRLNRMQKGLNIVNGKIVIK